MQAYDSLVFTNNAAPKNRYNLKNALKNVKIDFLNIRNPKVFDAEGRDWMYVTRQNESNMSTRDLEEKYLHQGDPKTVRETERAIKLIQSGLLNLESIQYDAKPVFGGLTFKQDAHSITVDYNGLSISVSKYMLDNEVFKNRVTNFLLKIQDKAQKKAVEEGVDGVIISNVLDYGNGNNV